MVEITESSSLVHLQHVQQHEGVLAAPAPVTPRAGVDVNQIANALNAPPPPDGSIAPDPAPSNATSTSTLQPDTPHRAEDAQSSFRQTRLAITAGLVVLLLVVWIIQRRGSAQR